MLYLDLKYLHFVQNKLEGFVRKKDHVFLSRCPICGDSATNKNKKRFYIYSWKNELRVRCHNCGYSNLFGFFLKEFDTFLYEQYRVELFKEKYGTSHNNKTKIEEHPEPEIEPVDDSDSSIEYHFYKICTPLNKLPPANPAVKYCIDRKIPKFYLSRLYYIDDTTKLNQIAPDLELKYGDARLVIPFFDKQGKLIGLTCRSLKKTAKLRYLSVKLKENVTQIFGLDRVDPTKTIYVVEGPIDSLFLPNCIAVTGTAFGKIESVLEELNIASDQVVMIIDNQPRNEEVVKILERLIHRKFNVVIWDINEKVGKDINEMIKDGGMTPKDVFQSIKRCTYRGLEAMVKFIQWKKC